MSGTVSYERLGEGVLAAIEAAATVLPADILAALERTLEVESAGAEGSCEASRSALAAIVENIRLSAEGASPICQDTGYPTFWVEVPKGWDRARVAETVRESLRSATARSVMRPNAVDPLTGRNSGDNVGVLVPAIYLEEAAGEEEERVTLRVLLKGGGSENVSAQYRLPHAPLKAGRDLDGVRRVALHAVFEAQGFGCSPGIVGVAIGGDRAQGYALAKKQLLRPLGDRSRDERLAGLEETLVAQADELGIGAMGFGGRTTLLGAKVAAAHRHPACFFVTVAYACWALRRKTMVFDGREYEVRD